MAEDEQLPAWKHVMRILAVIFVCFVVTFKGTGTFQYWWVAASIAAVLIALYIIPLIAEKPNDAK